MAADIAPVLDDNSFIDVRPVTLDGGTPVSYGVPMPVKLLDLQEYFADGGVPFTPAAAQANSTATDVAGIVADFNALLAKLRTAGIIAT